MGVEYLVHVEHLKDVGNFLIERGYSVIWKAFESELKNGYRTFTAFEEIEQRSIDEMRKRGIYITKKPQRLNSNEH